MPKTETLVKRLIDSVWTLEIERVEGGVKILSHTRDRYVSPKEEKEALKFRLIEDDNRKVLEVCVFDKGHSIGGDSQPIEHLKVVNPQHVFSYDA